MLTWAQHPGAVCLAGLPSGLTWKGSLGVLTGPFGAGRDAGEAEAGSQEVAPKSHNGWTLNPGGDSCGHTGPRAEAPPGPPPARPSVTLRPQRLSPAQAQPPTAPWLRPKDGDWDPWGTFIR